MPLPRRTAVVTGGTRGLGRALVLALGRDGWRVYTMARGRPALARLAKDAAAEGLPIIPIHGDVTEPAAVGRLTRRLAADRRRVSLLVHNASLLGPRRPLAEWPSQAFDDVLAVNLAAPFHLTHRLLERLHDDAVVMFVSSGVTTVVRTRWGAYEVSKVAVERLAAIWAAELEERGITVVSVDPGRMRTRMRAAAYPDEDPDSLPDPGIVAGNIVRLVERIALADTGRRIDVGA
jgi:NAD(P)-dependent dehydrogenase (short-subunit alcohol dehydrogenase family)